MTNDDNPIQQQPKSDEEIRRGQAVNGDRGKRSTDRVEEDDEPMNFGEHDSRLTGNRSIPREESQSQLLGSQTQKQGGNDVQKG